MIKRLGMDFNHHLYFLSKEFNTVAHAYEGSKLSGFD